MALQSFTLRNCCASSSSLFSSLVVPHYDLLLRNVLLGHTLPAVSALSPPSPSLFLHAVEFLAVVEFLSVYWLTTLSLMALFIFGKGCYSLALLRLHRSVCDSW